MAHFDLILSEQSSSEIRISMVGDALPSGALSERVIVDRGEVAEMGRRISRDLLDWANRPPRLRSGPPILETLAQSGLALYQTLFGGAGDALRALKHRWSGQERYCLVHLDEGLADCPVELCHDGDAFLCETFRMGRHITTSRQHCPPTPVDTKSPRILILANPSEDPCLGDSTEEEVREIRSALQSWERADLRVHMGKAVDGRLLDRILPGAAVVHFVGHADATGGQSEPGGWRLFGRRWYGAERIARLQNPPALVFANACSTARSGEWAGSTSLVRAFLERGTRAFIGTWWEVGSPFAAQFAAAFYRALARGETIGGALAGARKDTQTRFGAEEAAWASYVLYGDPRSRLYERLEPERSAHRRWIPAVLPILVALGILVPSALDHRDMVPDTVQAPVAENGYLTFESEPAGAVVRVDGEPRGTAPLTLELSEGAHEVSFDLGGYRMWEASAVVDPHKPQIVRARLEALP